MIIDAGLTVRLAGLVVTLFCVTLSDQITVHGPVPVNAAWIVADCPAQIAVLPLTVAVGSGLTVKPTLDDVTGELHAPLTTQSKPDAADAASAAARLLICNVTFVTPLYVEPFPEAPLATLTPFFLH